MSQRSDIPDDPLRIDEWVRTFSGGTGEVFTLYPPEVSEKRWKRAACTEWAISSGPLNDTREYPGCAV